MSFNKLTAFTQKVADAADQLTGNPAATKAIFDAAPEELRTYFNNLVDALKSTASGDSGAKNTGATAISGLTGTDVQTLLESLYNLAKKVPPSEVDLNTLNGWVTTDLSIYQPKLYKMDNNIVVFDGGRIKSGTTTGGTAIMNIPATYRPSKHVIWKEGNTIFELDGASGNIIAFGLDASDTIVGQTTWLAVQ